MLHKKDNDDKDKFGDEKKGPAIKGFNLKKEDIIHKREDANENKEKHGNIVRLEFVGSNKDEKKVDDNHKTEPNAEEETANDMASKFKNFYEEYQNRDIHDILNEAYNIGDKKTAEDRLALKREEELRGGPYEPNTKINYAEGVLSKRLIDGKLYDIELLEIDDDEKPEEFDINKSVFAELYKREAKKGDEASKKRLDKVIKRTISNVKEMTSIKVFRLFSFFWIVSIAVMSAFQLIYSNDFFNNTDNLIDIMLEANKQLSYFARVQTDLLDLEYLMTGYFQDDKFANYTGLIFDLNVTTSNILANSKTLMDKSYLEKIGRANDEFKFFDYMSIKESNQASYFSLSMPHHIDMILSSLMNLTRQWDPTSNFVSMVDIETIRYNFYRELKPKIDQYAETLYYFLLDETSSIIRTQFKMIVLLICEAIASIIFLLYFIWLKTNILKKKQDILFLFLDIPRSEVMGIKNKCDSFLNFTNVSSDPYEEFPR
jgi:hypothetical protein